MLVSRNPRHLPDLKDHLGGVNCTVPADHEFVSIIMMVCLATPESSCSRIRSKSPALCEIKHRSLEAMGRSPFCFIRQ